MYHIQNDIRILTLKYKVSKKYDLSLPFYLINNDNVNQRIVALTRINGKHTSNIRLSN